MSAIKKILLLISALVYPLASLETGNGAQIEDVINLLGLFPPTPINEGNKADNQPFIERGSRLLDLAETLKDEDQNELEKLKEEAREDRVVSTTLTANQIANYLNEAALTGIREYKWDVSKRFRPQFTDVPYKAGNSDEKMRLTVTHGYITGLGSLKTERASLDVNNNELSTRLGFNDVYVNADFEVSVPAVGSASASKAQGKVQVKLRHAWIDAKVNMDDNGLPLNIKKFKATSVDPLVVRATNIGANSYKPVFQVAFGEALKQITTKVFETNIKVRFNQGLQKIKADGSYGAGASPWWR
ncbi:uncharacterized protein [Palaemon carinicauda]|uniref:uncharacterized protein n=1 Tax=Palaemon carinicauda TaxID=392227 RepID=UPI0035B6105F